MNGSKIRNKEKKLSELISSKPGGGKRRTATVKRNLKMEANKKTVVNISNVPLSDDETSLLSRGLSFCPKPLRIALFQLEEDIKQFSRRLRLREIFYNPNEINPNKMNSFKTKSKWTPPNNRNQSLETYITSVREEIHHSRRRSNDNSPRRRSNNNITSQERRRCRSYKKEQTSSSNRPIKARQR